MIVRLAGQTGTIIDTPPNDGDREDRLIRPAILVHEGTFQSQDGEISFDEERIQKIVSNHNDMINKLAKQYGGIDKMPVGAYPPILDQHADDSGHRVQGRLASLLRFEKRTIPGVGALVACATADIVFLGKDTVDKVKDGRIYHLSIGIDENTNTLGETSTVIEPACPGAMILKKGKSVVMQTKTKSSKGGTEKMSANKKELKAQHRAKLSAEIREAFSQLSKNMVSTSQNIRLEKKKIEIKAAFKRLMISRKMTPVEYGKLDFMKLAALDDTASQLLITSYEAREPVVEAGQRGSTQSINFSEIGKSLEAQQFKRLKAEIKGDFTRMGGKKIKLAEADQDDKNEKDPEKKVKETGTDIHELEKKENDQDQKKELADGLDSVSDDSAVSQAIKALQTQMDEQHTQIARIAGMVNDLMGSDDDEEENKDDVEPSSEAVVAAQAEAQKA